MYTIPYVIYHLQNVTEMNLQYKNHVDHYIYNMSLGASYWVPLCGTGLLGWGWWISSHLSWTHIYHQDSISICRRSYQPQCICNFSLSSDSVHWESLFSAAAGSNGSYFSGKYLYNSVNCRIYFVSYFSSLLYSVIIPSSISYYCSSHPNNKFHEPAPDPPLLLAFLDVYLMWLLTSYVCMGVGSFFLHPPCFPHKLYHLPMTADLFGLNFTKWNSWYIKLWDHFCYLSNPFLEGFCHIELSCIWRGVQ